MTNSNRVMVNTIAQYVRTIINILLSLYSTRLILNALGSTDYGLYSVIAGVVSMLSFVSNALVISTQRYLSFYHGKKDKNLLSKVFGNSLLIHILISVLLLIILVSICDIVVIKNLDIPVDRVSATRFVYIMVVLMIVFSFITSPFRALYIARENIVYISIVDILDGVLKVISAVVLSYITYDRLIIYSVFMAGIMLFNFIAFSSYSLIKYEECHFPKKKDIDGTYIKNLLGFASWTLYSTGCVVMRTQGVAVIINKFFGVLLNASYGIAQQVSGALVNLAQAIANALSPQIIKSEGEGNRNRMLYLAGIESKYAFIMLSIASIPILFEMPFILQLWLHDVPNYAVMFCRMVIIAALADTITSGLGIANQATGNIKIYSLIFGTVKLSTLPLAFFALKVFNEPVTIMLCFVICEVFSSVLRLWFLKITAGLEIVDYLKKSTLPALSIAFSSLVTCVLLVNIIHWNYRIVLLFPASIFISIIVLITTMSSTEKNYLLNLLRNGKRNRNE